MCMRAVFLVKPPIASSVIVLSDHGQTTQGICSTNKSWPAASCRELEMCLQSKNGSSIQPSQNRQKKTLANLIKASVISFLVFDFHKS